MFLTKKLHQDSEVSPFLKFSVQFTFVCSDALFIFS